MGGSAQKGTGENEKIEKQKLMADTLCWMLNTKEALIERLFS